jgi:hypothetical protein
MSALFPPNLPTRIWLVTRPSGERDLIHREPLEGMTTWAKGVDATVAEYRLTAVVHTPPPKKRAVKR